MAVSKLQSTSVGAPGFLGLNTQDSGVNLESGYATVATNCVIDKFGRLGARKGWDLQTTSTTLSTDAYIEAIFEFKDVDGSQTILSTGDGKMFTGTTTQTALTVYTDTDGTVPNTGATIGNRMQFASLLEGTGQNADSYALAVQEESLL